MCQIIIMKNITKPKTKSNDLLKALIMAQNLLDKCEDELGGFTRAARGQRRTIDELIRKYSDINQPVTAG